jgi:hypothetical protein
MTNTSGPCRDRCRLSRYAETLSRLLSAPPDGWTCAVEGSMCNCHTSAATAVTCAPPIQAAVGQRPAERALANASCGQRTRDSTPSCALLAPPRTRRPIKAGRGAFHTMRRCCSGPSMNDFTLGGDVPRAQFTLRPVRTAASRLHTVAMCHLTHSSCPCSSTGGVTTSRRRSPDPHDDTSPSSRIKHR